MWIDVLSEPLPDLEYEMWTYAAREHLPDVKYEPMLSVNSYVMLNIKCEQVWQMNYCHM